MTDDWQPAHTRAAYRYFLTIPTRWMDNDIYGHVNNVVYYSYVDTVANEYLVAKGVLDPHAGRVIGLAVESRCRYRMPIAFPDIVEAGLGVGRLGNSSVRYEVGLFKQGLEEAAALAYFVHVFVERASGRPVPIPADVRAALSEIAMEGVGGGSAA